MELEYLEDPGSATPRVLLTYGQVEAGAALLQAAIRPLAAGDKDYRVEIESLPGFHGIDGCSLVCTVGDPSLGVPPIDGAKTAFHCVLTDSDWSQVCGLLEPFAASAPRGAIHQYLTTDGPIDWIISTSRAW